ncbi:MAG: lamin tail domain-containing protein, partial [Verrucomicrobiales bacterium]
MVFVTRRGPRLPRRPHRATAPAFRVSGSALTFTDCTITDISGKIAQTAASGGADSSLTFQRCHLGRASMGPELFDTALVLEDSHLTEMLGVYREDGVVDDDDGIYLHTAGAGQTMAIRRCVVANCQDDGIDMLDGETTVEDTIIRNIADKGVSVFTNPFHISGSIITGCDIGISAKGGGTDVVPVDIDHCTIAGNTSRGIYAENKSGEPDVTVIYSVTNSIIRSNGDSVGTDYDPADITITFTNLDEAWPGAGNQTGDPLFVSAGARDFHLAEGSPAIGAGDDASDLGALPYVEGGGGSAPGEVRWTVAGGPYHIIGDTTVPVNTTLVIEPGVSVFFDRDIELDIEGVIRAIGTADARIQFTALPSAAFAADPAGNGSLPDGPPKSDGIKIIDSMSPDNIISYADIAHAQDNLGAIGVIRSQCLIDHCTFRGTHIRMVYTEDSNTIVQYCAFPNMFNEGEAADALGLDNISESTSKASARSRITHCPLQHVWHEQVLTPTSMSKASAAWTRSPSSSATALPDRATSRWTRRRCLCRREFLLQPRMTRLSDRGYANGISTGDSGPNTTINVARNVFWDVDHAINLKIDTATIFEHNTCYKIHGDFDDRFGNPNVGSAINLYVDEPGAQPGDGAYAAGTSYQVPRVFGNADRPAGRTTPLELFDNLIEEITDITIGSNHAGQTIYDLGTNNLNGAPLFADPDNGDFALLPGSPAIGASPFGQDLGALVPGGAWIAGEPPALTASRGATLRVGGPGIFGYRWKLNDGAWSADLPIGSGFDPDPGTVRSATIELADLADGTYTVFVQGQDFAGNWQDEPTASLTWTVDAALAPQALINEVFAHNVSAYPGGGSYPDYVEFYNPGSAPFPLEGLTFSDDPATPARYVFPLGAEIPAGGYLLVTSDQLGFGFQSEGETVYLYDAGSAVLDSVAFGPQAADFSIGRIGHDRAWGLNVPTPGAANAGQLTGNIYDLKINEWFASGKVALTDDFIEIYNPSRLPVHLGGLFLTDHANTNPLRTQIRPLSFVGAGDVVAFWGGGGPDGLGFNLSSDIELLGLFDAGGTAIDTVFTGPQTEDYAQRRTANGGSDLEFHRLPTPGVRVPGGGSSTGSANLIAADATWRYRDDNTDLGSAWRDPAFDDSGWPSGQAALYREDSDLPAPAVKNTEVNIGTPTHYFRHAFNVDADPANVALELSLLIDDGAVVYLNGTEIYRVRVTDDPVSFSSSSGTIVNATWEGPFAIPSDALVNGENVLAVEVHQNTPASVDMVFDLILDAEIT